MMPLVRPSPYRRGAEGIVEFQKIISEINPGKARHRETARRVHVSVNTVRNR